MLQILKDSSFLTASRPISVSLFSQDVQLTLHWPVFLFFVL